MKTPWLSYLKNKIYSEDYYVQFIGLKSEDSRHPIYWREQSGRECVFPPSRMLLIPESQLAALELRLQGSRVPFGEPQCMSKPSISFQGFITGRYVRLGPTAAHPVVSQTASEVGGWTGDRFAHKDLQPGSRGQPSANGTWPTNQLIPLGLFEMKTQKVDRSRAGWRDGQPVAESTVVDLRKAGPQTRTCYDTSKLPELLTDHQRLGCPLNNVLLLRQRWLPVLFPPS